MSPSIDSSTNSSATTSTLDATAAVRRVKELTKRIPLNRSTAQAAGRMTVATLRRRVAFPLLPPSIPYGVEVPPEPSPVGGNYDTEWARRYPARVSPPTMITRPRCWRACAPQYHM